jgi:hypothetical protein
MAEAHDDATTIRGKDSRTRPFTLAAPRLALLTPEQEQAVLDALTQLLADWADRQKRTQGSQAVEPGSRDPRLGDFTL